jgi:cytidine deaminase
MTEKTISTVYTECSIRELPAPIRTLIGAAKDMVKKSYAPYSQFHVGAALELSDGTVITGNNQENASYPCGTCAERSVLNYAKSNFPNLPVTKLAIAAENDGHYTSNPLPPCGLCRQALLEAEQRQEQPITLYLCGEEKIWVIPSAAALLPLQFDGEALNAK